MQLRKILLLAMVLWLGASWDVTPVAIPLQEVPYPVSDADNDGVLDTVDQCPYKPGAAADEGCPPPSPPPPDQDKDLLPDRDDACPAASDCDKDGVIELHDACPTVAGEVARSGCPAQALLGPGYTVTSSADPGDGVCDAAECTLREAIQAANAVPNGDAPDAILFAIPACGPEDPCRIELGFALPTLRDAVVVDGFSQPNAKPNSAELDEAINARYAVVLDGRSQVDVGLRSPEASTLRGLVFEGFSTAAVHLWNGSLTILSGNFIGTDASGTQSRPNGVGVLVEDSFDLTIGGATPADRNLISGNLGAGISLSGVTHCNAIQGNFIGTDSSGALALGNKGGSLVSTEVEPCTRVGGVEPGQGNLISGNGSHGIYIRNSPDVKVLGNRIGTDLTGRSALGNVGHGVFFEGAVVGVIGSAGAGNLISGNGGDGIHLSQAAYGNAIQGNLIGLDASGAKSLGNGGGGLVGEDVGPCTRLGGSEPGEANVIVNNTGPNEQVEELAISAMGYAVDGKLLVARAVPARISSSVSSLGSVSGNSLVGAWDLTSKREADCFALPFQVTDIEATDGGTALALNNGQVKFLETGETLESGLSGLVAFAQSGDTRVFATAGRITTCKAGVCVEDSDHKDVVDIQFPTPDLRVQLELDISLGSPLVSIFRNDKLAATIRNNPNVSGIAGFRISPGGLVAQEVEPCHLVQAGAETDGVPGMAIPGTGVKFVKFANLGAATPVARSSAAILQGHLDLERLTGAVKNLVVNDVGQMVDEAGVVYGALEGVSLFPTAMSAHFDFGSPLVGLSLGNGGVFVDDDGAGPGAPTLLAGIVRHFVSVESTVALPAGVTTISLTRGAKGSVHLRIEIPGSFVAQVDPDTLTLAGVAPTSIGAEITDSDEDSDPERVVSWSQPELEAAIKSQNLEQANHFARLVFTGKMLDGTPIRGTVGIELR